MTVLHAYLSVQMRLSYPRAFKEGNRQPSLRGRHGVARNSQSLGSDLLEARQGDELWAKE